VVAELDARYADLGLGLADCSIAVLAERYETRRLLSFDEGHFRAVAPLQGGSFELLPADT
jgi:predicted nucleic acid-binding protein